MSDTEKDRMRSGRTAQYLAAAELTRRNYDATLDEDRRTTRLNATSPKGAQFTVSCRNKKSADVSWVVEPFEEDRSLYFVLVLAELEQPYSAPQYWTLKSAEMKKIVDAYMKRNPSAKSANVSTSDVQRYANWRQLPP